MRARTPLRWIWLLVGCVFCSPTAGSAQDLSAPSEIPATECRKPWSLRVIPYLWAPAFDGDLTAGGVTANVDVSVGKTLEILWNDINFAALGQIEINGDQNGFIFNGDYVDVSPGRRVGRLDFDARLQLAIVDMTFTHELENLSAMCRLPEGSRLEALAGVRYTSLRSAFSLTGPRGNSAHASGTEEWVDPIFGARLRVPLGRCWTAQVRGDLGGFEIGDSSQFTWNIETTLEWRRSDRFSIVAGYRWLDIDYISGNGNRHFAFDFNLSGPILGFAFDF